MKLHKVYIKNYRSIKDITITFPHQMLTLVGINESGKTNVLSAISLLDKDVYPAESDVRNPVKNEKPITDSFVQFNFELEKHELQQIYEGIENKILGELSDSVISKGAEYSFIDYFNKNNRGIWHVNIISKNKHARYFIVDPSYKVLSNWKTPIKKLPPEVVIELKPGETAKLNSFSLININKYKGIPKEYLEDATLSVISGIYSGAILNYITDNLPSVIFWQYSENNLLPSKVNIDDFCNDPDTCRPLSAMFNLYGIDNDSIEDSIESATTRHKQGLRNLLNNISEKATESFRSTWKEYKSVEFSLPYSGEYIEPCIKDHHNMYEMSMRSDGFKRFVSFLLLISFKDMVNELNNTVLIIDEPDISLHPTGVRFLRDELIRISRNNYVITSTHSIFMIDEDNLNRHIMVIKNNEITTIEYAEKSNYSNEEVLYNALGYSIFEVIKNKNILFEGWRDKVIFQNAMKRVPKKYSKLKNLFDGIGIAHARGAKTFKHITPLIELAHKNCLIISDSDRPSREQQEIFLKDKCHGTWLRYDEIDSDIIATTGEDFVKLGYLLKSLDEVRKLNKRYNDALKDFKEENICNSKHVISDISKWVIRHGLKKSEAELLIEELKTIIFNGLGPSDIDTKYYAFLEKLVVHL